MPALLAILQFVVANAATWIKAGEVGYEIYTNVQAVIDAHAPPGDAEWAALDAQVKTLQAAVRDTSGDYVPPAA